MSLSNEPVADPSALLPRDPFRPPRILVAEDDPGMREIVTLSLRHEGYEVVEETDGGRLLVRVAAVYAFGATVDPIDLIVSDIYMPVCTGLDILQGLRNAHWSTPVILMTALRDDAVRKRATDLGAFLFEKPLHLADLVAKVHELLPSPLAA